MRKIFLFLTTLFFFTGCSLNDDDQEPVELYEPAPIESVELPPAFELGNTYSIKVQYTHPNSCSELAGYDYEYDEGAHYFGIFTYTVSSDDSCADEESTTEEITWNFEVIRNELYIFKFWQGVNDNGDPIFLTKEVPVIE